jgi:hypothetical protein
LKWLGGCLASGCDCKIVAVDGHNDAFQFRRTIEHSQILMTVSAVVLYGYYIHAPVA